MDINYRFVYLVFVLRGFNTNIVGYKLKQCMWEPVVCIYFNTNIVGYKQINDINTFCEKIIFQY